MLDYISYFVAMMISYLVFAIFYIAMVVASIVMLFYLALELMVKWAMDAFKWGKNK